MICFCWAQRHGDFHCAKLLHRLRISRTHQILVAFVSLPTVCFSASNRVILCQALVTKQSPYDDGQAAKLHVKSSPSSFIEHEKTQHVSHALSRFSPPPAGSCLSFRLLRRTATSRSSPAQATGRFQSASTQRAPSRATICALSEFN